MLLLISLGGTLISYLYFSNKYKEHLNEIRQRNFSYIKLAAQTEMNRIAGDLFVRNLSSVKLGINKVLTNADLVEVSVFNKSGDLIISTNTSPSIQLEPSWLNVLLPQIGKSSAGTFFTSHDDNRLAYVQPICAIGDLVGFLMLVDDITYERELRLININLLVFSAGVNIFLILLVYSFLAKKVIKPLRRFLYDLESCHKDFSHRLVNYRNDEIGGVALEFNEMMDKLHKSFIKIEHEKEFSDLIIESLPGIFCIYGEDLKLKQWNRTCERALGYSSEELKKIEITDLIANVDSGTLINYLNRFVLGNLQVNRLNLITKARKQIPYIFSEQKALIEGEQLFVGIGMDLSERESLKKELAHSLELFEALFEQAPISISIYNKDGFLLKANAQYAKNRNLDKEIIGSNILNDPLMKQCGFDKYMGQILGGDTVYIPELCMEEPLNDNEEPRWRSISAFPVISNNEPDFEKFVVVGTDITERKKAEEAVRKSEEKFRNTFEYAPIGIVMLSLDGNFLEANQSFCNMIGYFKEELLFLNFANITHPDEQAKDKENIEKLIKGEINGFQREKRYIHKNGDEIWGNVNVSLLKNRDGNPIHLIGQILDTTKAKGEEEKKKNLEQQLQQSQKMEAIGTLASGIAHDFNNILTPIFAFTQLLERKLANADDHIKKHLHGIGSAAFRAADLVRQILNFSRKFETKKNIVDILPIAKETVKLLRSALPAMIEMKTEFTAENTLVMCDPTQIHQVLMNLGTNARDAMYQDGGVLDIKINNYHETMGDLIIKKGEYLLISVRDTGIGMDQKTKVKIFDPFFTTKPVGTGTGLGLAISYGIINSLDGYIHVFSEIGRGTKFHVYLPVVEKTGAFEPDLRQEIPEGTGSILLVDDEELNVTSYTALLGDIGYTVEGFTNSQEALEAFLNNPEKYDLILTDYTMRNLTGIKLIERIRQSGHNKIPVIVFSGISEAISDAEIEKVGIEVKLSKPIDLYTLATAIKKVLKTKG